MKNILKIMLILTVTASTAMAAEGVPTVVVEPTVPGTPQVVVESPVLEPPAVTYVVPEVVATPPAVVEEIPVAVDRVVPVPQTVYAAPPVVTETVVQPAVPVVSGAVWASVSQLMRSYAGNQVAADELYRGRMVETWGVVMRVVRDEFGAAVVELSPDGLAGGGVVTCRMQPGQMDRAMRLVPGQSIYLVGLCEGMTRERTTGYGVQLRDAVLLP